MLSIIINNTSCHELSVLIDPAYRRHGLGSMLVKQMLLTIDNSKTFTTSVTLVGTDEHFANNCGFDYSHSEHFMTRKPYNELDAQYKGNEKEFRRVTPSERYLSYASRILLHRDTYTGLITVIQENVVAASMNAVIMSTFLTYLQFRNTAVKDMPEC